MYPHVTSNTTKACCVVHNVALKAGLAIVAIHLPLDLAVHDDDNNTFPSDPASTSTVGNQTELLQGGESCSNDC